MNKNKQRAQRRDKKCNDIASNKEVKFIFLVFNASDKEKIVPTI